SCDRSWSRTLRPSRTVSVPVGNAVVIPTSCWRKPGSRTRGRSSEAEASLRGVSFVELDEHGSLGAHGPGVVARGDRDGVAALEAVRASVRLLDAELTGGHDADVDGLTAVDARVLGRRVPGPSPTRGVAEPQHRHPGHPDDVDCDPAARERAALLRIVEAQP